MAYSPASIVAVSIVLPVIALVAVCLRFWVRLRVQPSYIGADDWLIAGAVVFSLADGANLAVGKRELTPPMMLVPNAADHLLAAILGDQGRYYAGDIPPERSNLESKVGNLANSLSTRCFYAHKQLRLQHRNAKLQLSPVRLCSSHIGKTSLRPDETECSVLLSPHFPYSEGISQVQ